MEGRNPNLQRLVQRNKIGGANAGNKPHRNAPGDKKKQLSWPLLILTGVAICLVLAVAATVGNSSMALRSVAPADTTAANRLLAGEIAPSQAMAPTAAAASNDAFVYFADKAAPGSTGGSPTESAPATGGNQAAQAQAQTQPWDRMIVRTATLQLTVKDVSAGVSAVQRLVTDHDGYVLQLDNHQEGEYTVASITIQVPSQEFDKIMPELRKLDGQVKKIGGENVSSSDVTEEYTDLQSQLRNLQATEARMLALQQKAEKLEDILAVDRELRQVQGQIEQIQGRVNFLSKRSQMSSITISLSPEALPVEPTPVAEKAWDPAETALRAWNASLDLLSRMATVAITIAVFMWWAMPFLLILLWVARRARRNPPPIAPSTPAGEPSAS